MVSVDHRVDSGGIKVSNADQADLEKFQFSGWHGMLCKPKCIEERLLRTLDR